MKNIRKRVLSLVATLLMCLSLFTGCVAQQGTTGSKGDEPGSTAGSSANSTGGSGTQKPTTGEIIDANFETIYEDGIQKDLKQYNASNPEENGLISYSIKTNVGNKNYMRIVLETDVDLVGYIQYSNTTDPSKSHKEKFFIEAGSKEFTTFLDAFRSGAFATYEKTIEKITLQNVDSTKAGKVTVKSVDFSDRTYDPSVTMYIDDGTLRVGTSLGMGGAITYVARINANVVEYIDADGNTCIGPLADTTGVDVISKEANLVNIYDLGREIQQSFYWPVKPQHGYVPTSDKKYPGDLNYNPIQCGSAGSVGPQIVDYYYTEDEIYVKAYGADWYLVNQVDATYFETWLSFGNDGTLVVKNRITNFGQFVNTDGLEFVNQESPAFYSVYPLDYFYAETVDGTIFDNELSAVGSGSILSSATDTTSGPYWYNMSANKISNSWVAFVTEKKFGLGIYNPSADCYVASSGTTTTKYMSNQKTHPDFYVDDYSSYIPSCYTNNYGYLNTAIRCKMVDFEPLEFSYALYAGTVQEMKSAFRQLESSGAMETAKITWPHEDVE